MEESIFSRIIKGEIPCHKVYEDAETLAFLDIHPIQTGHTLVVTKAQVDHIWDLSDEQYQALWSTVRKVARQLRRHFPAKKRVGVIVEGFDVAHVHVKVFPIDSGDELRFKPDMTSEPDHTALAELAAKLAF